MNDNQKIIRGIGVSDGIAHAKVFLLERERAAIPHRIITDSQVETEILRFQQALEEAKKGLQEIKKGLMSAVSRDPAFIIDAHIMMLEDELLVDGAIELITKDRINAEWALRRKVSELVSVFTRMTDPYLRERGRDVEEVSERVIRELVGQITDPVIKSDEPVIVVAHELTPAETAHMAFDEVKGFATEIGSLTSHTAIVAKSLMIPAVVGAKAITGEIAHGDTILIDGHSGTVIVNPHPDTVKDYENRKKWLVDFRQTLKKFRGLPSETLDGHKIKLAANLEILEELQFMEESGASGVGLYRTEYLYLDREDLPTEDEHFQNYQKLVRASHPHGATIRTLDLGGDKFKSKLTISNEMNPAMGLRAIRFCLNRPDLFKTQLRAILKASASGKTRVMFPMISGYQEFRDAKRLLHEAREELNDQGIPIDQDIEVGIMIEIPSAVLIADELAEAADFFSIGTNDLIQYTLAIDRINENVSYLYQPLHPAILRIIKQVVDAGHRQGIPVHMCGAMAGEPSYLPVLIGLDLDELSMPMSSILRVNRILRSIKKSDAKILVEELLTYKTVLEIHEKVKQTILTKWADVYALELEEFDLDDHPPVG